MEYAELRRQELILVNGKADKTVVLQIDDDMCPPVAISGLKAILVVQD